MLIDRLGLPSEMFLNTEEPLDETLENVDEFVDDNIPVQFA